MNAIEAFVPPDVVKTFTAFLEFYYIAHRNIITEASLEQLRDALSRFHTTRQVFVGTSRPDNHSAAFSLPRQHTMSHYYDHIKNFGAPNGVCSSITESKHISAVKQPWRWSNKHVPLPQMLKANTQLDKLAAAHADFLARSMLVDSCLIQAVKDIIVDNEDSTDDTTGDSDSESDISSEAEFHHSHINNSDCTRDPNGNTDTSYEQLQTLCLPPQMLSASQAEDNDCGPVESGPLMNEVRLVSRKGQSPYLMPLCIQS